MSRSFAGKERLSLRFRRSWFAPGTVRLTSAFLLIGLALAGCGRGQSATANAAASVNGRQIPLSAYHVELTYMRHNAADTAQLDVCSSSGYNGLCRQLKQTALNTLIGEELVRQYAAAHHIAVSEQEFARQWAIVLNGKFHNDEAVLRAYLKARGITETDLEGMIRKTILQNEVLYQVTKDMPRSGHATELSRIVVATDSDLTRVQNLLAKGTPFNALAAQLTRNKQSLCAQQGCGELGWLPDAMVPPGQEEAIRARPGTVVGPIPGQGGYTLLLVEAHLNRYPYTADQDFAIRQQLFGKWLSTQEHRATVRRYVTA